MEMEGQVHRLHIHDVTVDDAGIYKAVLGEAQSIMALRIKGKVTVACALCGCCEGCRVRCSAYFLDLEAIFRRQPRGMAFPSLRTYCVLIFVAPSIVFVDSNAAHFEGNVCRWRGRRGGRRRSTWQHG